MKIKNKFNGECIASSQIVEYPLYFQLTKMELYKYSVIHYAKTAWEKVDEENELLDLILKDFNHLHQIGFDKIEQQVKTEVNIEFLLSNDICSRFLTFNIAEDILYYDRCVIESVDLKASIRAYLAYKRP